jgi:signal transduction histidine kinase
VIRGSYLLKFALVLGCLLGVLVLLGSGIFLQTSEILDENVEETVVNQATLEAEELTDWVESNKRIAQLVSGDRIFANRPPAELDTYLRSVRDNRLQEPTYELYYLHYRNRTAVASTEETDRRLSTQPWYDRLQFSDVDDVFISAPYQTDDGTTVMAFISPVNNVVEHHLVLVVPVEDRTQAPQTFDGSFTTVVDSEGLVLFSSERQRVLTPYLSEHNGTSTAVRQGVRDETGFLETHKKQAELDRRVVVAYAPVDGTEWTVIKHVPAETAYGLQTVIQWGLLALLGCSLLAVLVFGWTIGRGTIRDVRALSKKASAIEAGAYDTPVESDRSDELGVLSDSIEGMRTELLEQIHEAESARTVAEQNNKHLQTVDRMLRHNIYNHLTVVRLNTQRTAELCSADATAEIQTILDRVDSIIDQVDKQRLITTSLAQDMEPEIVNIGRSASTLCDRLSAEFPGTEITYNGPSSVSVVALPTCSEALAELVENAISHNDTDTPSVTVTVREADDWVAVDIEDNGPGIPEIERELVMGKVDRNQLQHSSGVGLWMVSRVVRQSDGTIAIEDRDPRGSLVRIRFRRPDDTDEPGSEDATA